MRKKRKSVNEHAMAALTEKFKSRSSIGRRVYSAKDFLELPDCRALRVGSIPPDILELIKLSALGNPKGAHELADVEKMLSENGAITEQDIERFETLEGRHRFNGTLAIAILQAIRQKHGVAVWNFIRRSAWRSWKDSILLDLVEAIGRPTVPLHLLPVFALYEVERRTGEPVENLTPEQLRLLGL
jgi:hypothetical protein